MKQVWVGVAFEPVPDETDEQLGRLTRELELDLRELGVIEHVPVDPERDGKGAGEVVAATLTVLATAEPAYVEALVNTLVVFLRRNEGRRAQLRVGDLELAIDQPSEDEVAELIRMAWSAIERGAIERADR